MSAVERHNVLGVLVSVVDYASAKERIIEAARTGSALAVSAMAVHGVMTGVLDATHRYRLNQFDMLVPDGQPVRWALNWLHGAGLRDRVYGPTLMLKLCEQAARERLPIFLYGSRPEVLQALADNLCRRFPGLVIAGMQPSRFRRVTAEEQREIAAAICESSAKLVFVGLGCPRQEVWTYENRPLLPMPVVAVGAAFDFHAGLLPQAPTRWQRLGLEWLFRLLQEPRRLWQRYLLLNPLYLALLAAQWLRLYEISPDSGVPPQAELRYG